MAPLRLNWGTLVAEPTECAIRPEGSELTIGIPGKLFVLSPELKTFNAPRLLMPARGDWTAQVTIPGKRLLPGTVPLPDLPFTFQGAGLTVWQNEANYLVFFRTSFYYIEGGVRFHRVLMEYCRDGKPSNAYLDARDADIGLKLERRGQEIRGSYTRDGRDWIEVKRQPVALPADVQIGVSAANASPKPFEAHLVHFELVAGKPATGK